MVRMFEGAAAFNQDIGDWLIESLEDASRMLIGTTSFTTANYNLLLTKWYAQASNIQNNVKLHVGNIQYGGIGPNGANAVTARAALISNYNWDIRDGGKIYQQPDPANDLIQWNCNGHSISQIFTAPGPLSTTWQNVQNSPRGNVPARNEKWWQGRWLGNLDDSNYKRPDLPEFEGAPKPWVNSPYQPRDNAQQSQVMDIRPQDAPVIWGNAASELSAVKPAVEEFEKRAVIQGWDWDPSWDPTPQNEIIPFDYNEIGQALGVLRAQLICTQYESVHCLSEGQRCSIDCNSNKTVNCASRNVSVCSDHCSTSQGRVRCGEIAGCTKDSHCAKTPNCNTFCTSNTRTCTSN